MGKVMTSITTLRTKWHNYNSLQQKWDFKVILKWYDKKNLTFVLLFYWIYWNRCEKKIECSASLAFYLFSLTLLINSIKHEHSCKILYICNKGSTHVRSSIFAIRGALMLDLLYLQQGEYSCKILYICNKGSTHVRSSISATRGALM